MFARPEDRLDELQSRLKGVPVVTRDLMSKVVACCCVSTLNSVTKAAKIDRLIELEAWTEAALCLVELELPQWKLRRLVYDDDAWLCSLSMQWNLSNWLGDCVETRHI
jgi:hypothetical protein